ncbi:phenylalanine--tRNA ligase subunit beta [bacterium]|nr:phenylalanine--tRNA ligase subunit beta [bacterium]
MPTISVDKNDLMQLIGRDYSVEQLEDLLSCVKGELKEYSQETGQIKIELNDTNRPDLWCPEGIARQIRFRSEELSYQLHSDRASPEKRIIVDENLKTIRPYVGAFIARGIPVTEQFLIQMIQTQEKLCDTYGKKRELVAIGIYDLKKIKFPVHYKGVAGGGIKFVPLGFEEEMSLDEILVRHPKGVEFAHLVNKRSLYPILLDDNSDVLSFPPVINSKRSGEVSVGDQDLFIEITGTNIEMVLHCLNILAYNFKDRGFEIEPVQSCYPYPTDYGKEVISPYPLENEVEVELPLFGKYLGCQYTLEEIKGYLGGYGLTVQGQGENKILVCSHPYRQDYMHPVDSIEDLAISIGYENFEPIMPTEFTIGKLSKMTLFEDRVRDVLIGFGFEEVILNILANKEDFGAWMHEDLIRISNCLSETYSSLRNSLIPGILKVEAKSSKSLYPHQVFEVGEVVERDETQNHGSLTKTKLAVLLCHAQANFSEMGSYLENLAYLMFWETKIIHKNFPIFIKGRSGEIVVNNESVGLMGEVHPEILEKWGIKMPTEIFELDLTKKAEG